MGREIANQCQPSGRNLGCSSLLTTRTLESREFGNPRGFLIHDGDKNANSGPVGVVSHDVIKWTDVEMKESSLIFHHQKDWWVTRVHDDNLGERSNYSGIFLLPSSVPKALPSSIPNNASFILVADAFDS
jgi:hypothetical protein